MRKLLALLIALAAPAFAAEHDVETLRSYLTPERLTEIETGEIVTIKQVREANGERSAGSGVAIGIVDSPVHTVWEVLTDSENLDEFMPRLQKVEVSYRDGAKVGLHYTLKVAWKTVQYHLDEVHDAENHHLYFTLDTQKEADIKGTTGAWYLVPHEQKTIAIYSVEADTGIAVPGFIENWLMNRDLPGVIEAVRDRAKVLASEKAKPDA